MARNDTGNRTRIRTKHEKTRVHKMSAAYTTREQQATRETYIESVII